MYGLELFWCLVETWKMGLVSLIQGVFWYFVTRYLSHHILHNSNFCITLFLHSYLMVLLLVNKFKYVDRIPRSTYIHLTQGDISAVFLTISSHCNGSCILFLPAHPQNPNKSKPSRSHVFTVPNPTKPHPRAWKLL